MEEREGPIWVILTLGYNLLKISLFFFLFVGFAISEQCQAQVQEIGRMFGF